MKHAVLTGCLLAALAAGASPAAAAQPGWRATYDTVMMWVNFLILAGVIYKFGRKPLLDFLRGQGQEVADQIEAVEKRRRRAAEDLAELEKKASQRDARMKALVERMEKEGALLKEKIIEQAQQEARHLLEDTGRRAGYQIEAAKKKFRSELVDMAVDMAREALPRVITPEDRKRLLSDYIQKGLPQT
ncbi:MAG: ATP synthase F0 subunit B [Deltaproteobacteria bacterium]|nr:ATP synthase F0 subunit B [Deltaproteobacteria bacterium]